MTTRPEIPMQDGWAVEMHGECVLFCNNAEKETGSSPGARVRVFSETKLREYADACVAAEIASLQAQVDALSGVVRMYLDWVNSGLIKDPGMVAIEHAAIAALAAVGR